MSASLISLDVICRAPRAAIADDREIPACGHWIVAPIVVHGALVIERHFRRERASAGDSGARKTRVYPADMSLHERIEAIHQLDDNALLRSLKRFVGSSNQLTALVLAHLAEVDARGAYRRWACDTLTAYCVYELRLSEDEAQRRCRAARIARQFPLLFEMLADASIHLTGILLLGPYLTEENHREVLARARYRRKSEIQRLVAELAPSCDVPALIEPLGPGREAPRVARSGWGAAHEALMGGVRQLVAGDGPAAAPSATEACAKVCCRRSTMTFPRRRGTMPTRRSITR